MTAFSLEQTVTDAALLDFRRVYRVVHPRTYEGIVDMLDKRGLHQTERWFLVVHDSVPPREVLYVGYDHGYLDLEVMYRLVVMHGLQAPKGEAQHFQIRPGLKAGVFRQEYDA